MVPGSIVVILVSLDNKVRDRVAGELLIGTLDEIYGDTVSVLLPSGEIYRGSRRSIALASEQQ
jgi:hypothetical protein